MGPFRWIALDYSKIVISTPIFWIPVVYNVALQRSHLCHPPAIHHTNPNSIHPPTRTPTPPLKYGHQALSVQSGSPSHCADFDTGRYRNISAAVTIGIGWLCNDCCIDPSHGKSFGKLADITGLPRTQPGLLAASMSALADRNLLHRHL